MHHLLGPRQAAEVTVNDNTVEAVVDERKQSLPRRRPGSPNSRVNNSMAIPSRPARGRKPIRRGPGQRIVDGKSFRLADEVRYIQRRAADYDGRIVTIGQLTGRVATILGYPTEKLSQIA